MQLALLLGCGLASKQGQGLRLAARRRPQTRLASSVASTVAETGSVSAAAAASSLRQLFGNSGRTLFVGEGDLGFSAAVCKTVAGGDGARGTYVSSTWDTPIKLSRSFQNASANVDAILFHGGRVLFEVDATKLGETAALQGHKFDTVCWMFPHVPGKQNIKRNRLLLQSFFSSARKVLAPGGSVLLALAQGQSGFTGLETNQDWLHSWKMSAAAAEAGLLVTNAQAFHVEGLGELGYSPQGHRGSGGSFPTRQAEIFRLEEPRDGVSAVQAPVFVHEIHLLGTAGQWSAHQLESKASEAARALLVEHGFPDALWAIHMVDFYTPDPTRCEVVSHTLQLAYCSTEQPVGRSTADEMRALMERELSGRLGLALRVEKAGGKVSKPHCWPIAQALLLGAEEGASGTGDDVAMDPALLNDALREFEPRLAQPQSLENPALLNADKNEEFTAAHHAAAWGVEAEAIRAVARRLWRRRVGVLIHQVGRADQKEHS